MKIQVLALAVAAMALTVACNNNKAAEVEDTLVEDTAVVEEMVEEEVEDTTTIAVAEAPVAKPAAKPAAKKDEPKVVNNEDGTKTVTTTRGSKKAEEEKAVEPTVTKNDDGTKTVTTKRGTKKQ